MAFLKESGSAKFFFLDRYIGDDTNLKEWVYITPDGEGTVTASGYFSDETLSRVVSPGDIIRVYNVTDRYDLTTAAGHYRLYVTSISGNDITVALEQLTGAARAAYDTRALAAAASIAAGYRIARIDRYDSASLYAPHYYKRVDSEPSHDGKFRSVDRYLSDGTVDAVNGGWWEYAEAVAELEHFGAVGDGTSADTAFAATAGLGRPTQMRSRADYLVSTRVSPVTGTRFFCPGQATVTFKTGAGGYQITDLATSKNDATVCGFLFSGIDDYGMEGVRFTTDGVQEAVIYPIRAATGTADRGCAFARLHFEGFALLRGGMLSLNSIGAGSYTVRDITAKDCGSAQGSAYWQNGSPQVTVVEVDNDRVGGVDSASGYMENIKGTNILLSGAALADYGQQTDIVNIAGDTVEDRSGPIVHGVVADGVGEVVDLFCSRAVVKGIRVRNVHNDVVKLIHGARFNDIEIESADYVGRSVVGIFGSSVYAQDTIHNNVRVGTVSFVGSIGSFTETAVVRFGSETLGRARQNNVRIGTVLADANLDYVIRDGGASNDNDNVVSVDRVVGSPAVAYVGAPPANVHARFTDGTDVWLTLSASQALASGTEATIQYNTVVRDRLSEAVTASYAVRCKTPGRKLVNASVRITGLNADDDVVLRIYKGASIVEQRLTEQVATGSDGTFTIQNIVDIAENEAGTTSYDLTVKVLLTTASGTAATSNSVTMSNLSVTDLA